MLRAVGHADALLGDRTDPLRLEAHVVALERARPDAVVADAALGSRRVLRDDVWKQIGAITELGRDVLREEQAHHVVHLAHRPLRRTVGRVDRDVGQRAVAHRPEDAESVELAVGGHVRVQPPEPVGDRIVVVGGRGDPRGRPLEHRQLADDRGDLGDQLHRARAGADHGHALAREIDRRIPAGRMERRTGEAVAALDVRVPRLVELTHGADDRVGNERLLGTVGPPDVHRPRQVVVRPLGGQHLGRELDVLANAEDIGALLEVLVQHVLRREVERPVVPLRERVAVVVVRVVDATPRIRVLPPGAADAGVLVDDHERHARLLQPPGGDQARHAGADDQDAEVGTGRELVELPARCTTVLAPVGELLFEQREVRGHRYATDGELEDLEQLVVRGSGCGLGSRRRGSGSGSAARVPALRQLARR